MRILILFGSPDTGWYPELVFLTVLFSNSTNLAVVFLRDILSSRLLKTYSETYIHLLDRQYAHLNLVSIRKHKLQGKKSIKNTSVRYPGFL